MRLDEPRDVDLALPTHRSVRAQRFPDTPTQALSPVRAGRVRTHRVSALPALLQHGRQPSVVRASAALLHAAAWAGSDRAAEWRIAAGVQQRLVTPVLLRETLALLPRLPRRDLVRTVLDDVELGAHAASELDFLRFLRSYRLPAPDQLQRRVRVGATCYLDAWWERRRVCAEVDGAHHRSAGVWEADVLRANDLVLHERHDRVLLLRLPAS